LVTASNRIELRRDGEREQKIWHRQKQILLVLQPTLRIFILAFGTMAVTTGVVTVLHLLTIRTTIDLPTQGCGAALLDRPHRFEMGGRHA
jgi:hypothetical protein